MSDRVSQKSCVVDLGGLNVWYLLQSAVWTGIFWTQSNIVCFEREIVGKTNVVYASIVTLVPSVVAEDQLSQWIYWGVLDFHVTEVGKL